MKRGIIMDMITYYSYEDLKEKALSANATQEDINNLGEWFDQYGDRYWNGEYYSIDNDNRLYPIYNKVDDDELEEQYEIVAYEIR